MPEVFVDTSPLQYLHQIDLLDLLPAFYGELFVPEAVTREIAVGRERGVSLPDWNALPWLKVRRVGSLAVLPLVSDLDRGEAEVLALALESPDPLVILDDFMARRAAQRLEITMTGTLGVLLKARRAGKIGHLDPLLDRLEGLHFRLDPATRSAVLRLAGEPEG